MRGESMRKLIVFNSVSLDGYISDTSGDMSWAHQGGEDQEWNAFMSDNASGGGFMLFGRTTYEMMSAYWPTEQAHRNLPVVAERMNNLPKMVFSRTLDQALWKNTTLVKDNLAGAVRKLKSEPGPDMVILGSGSIVAQLAKESLVDEFQIAVVPVVLGSGKTMFEGTRQNLKLTSTRSFPKGKVFLRYQPC
jgi:dihydrofolate reductase